MRPFRREFWATIAMLLAAFGGAAFWQQRVAASLLGASTDRFEAERTMPARAHHPALPPGARIATFAGGCFWGVEETFRALPGVLDTRAGYTGGTTSQPTYATVHQDKSGHVEAVEVTYDPARIRYEDLATAFFAHHDATTPANSRRLGRPYRSFLFFHDEAEKNAARTVIRTLTRNGHYRNAPRPLAVQVAPAGTFWPAEEYHQRYYQKRATGASCAL